MAGKLTRRDVLVAGAGAAGVSGLLWPEVALAQSGGATRPLLNIRSGV